MSLVKIESNLLEGCLLTRREIGIVIITRYFLFSWLNYIPKTTMDLEIVLKIRGRDNGKELLDILQFAF